MQPKKKQLKPHSSVHEEMVQHVNWKGSIFHSRSRPNTNFSSSFELQHTVLSSCKPSFGKITSSIQQKASSLSSSLESRKFEDVAAHSSNTGWTSRSSSTHLQAVQQHLLSCQQLQPTNMQQLGKGCLGQHTAATSKQHAMAQQWKFEAAYGP
ncbi:hypothetical protein V8G54_036107 [Vigna mungo]|uniref:Uncharacterized protein n=1 Tax=Vigna mungo TaxID=3915 RepID=A0AAQ3MH24_VIGMU